MTDYRNNRGTPIDGAAYRQTLIAAGLLKEGGAFPPRVDDNCLPLPRYRTSAAQDAKRYQRDKDD
jgi:hypothetical protein